jgi:hypothetical protein
VWEVERRWSRDIALAIATYVVGVIARWPFIGVEPHTPEGSHYYAAKYLWTKATIVHYLYGNVPVTLDYLFWGRPLFFLTLAVAAPFGFVAVRIFHVFLVATASPLVFFILRRLGVRPAIATIAALVMAVSTYLVVWTTLLLPDALATVFLLAALLAYLHDRPLATALFSLGAAWIKEISLVATGALLVAAFLHERKTQLVSLWPLRLGKSSTGLLLAGIAGVAPLAYSLAIGARFPGWGRGGEGLIIVDRLVLIGWFWFILVGGLTWARTRFMSSLALAVSLFYVVYRFPLGRAVEIWYHVMPASFAVLAVFLFVDEAATRIAAWRPSLKPVSFGPVLVVVLLLGVSLFGPFAMPGKGPLLRPFTRWTDNSWSQTLEYEESRGLELRDAFAAIGQVDLLFSIDLDWSDEFYRAGDHADAVIIVRSLWLDAGNISVRPWSLMIEERAERTILQKIDHPVSAAVIETYRDCIVFENTKYALLDGRNCQGRADQLDGAVRGSA